MALRKLPLARRVAEHNRLAGVRVCHNVPVFLNGGALFALRHVLKFRGPLPAVDFARWVQGLVDRELQAHGLPTEVLR